MVRIEPYDLKVALKQSPRATVCVTFNGGAWRGLFFAGVVEAIQKRFPDAELKRWAFCGTSAGAVYALALAMGFPAEDFKTLLCSAAARARARCFGVAFCVNTITGQIVLDMLETVSEEALVARLRGRYALCVTGVVACKACPYIVCDFDTKAELFNAMVCSCNIPLFSSLEQVFPKIRGVTAFDGGLTPDGCVPTIPSHCNVFSMCFGKSANRGEALPAGFTLDIAEHPPVPIAECFKTPRTDEDARATMCKGKDMAEAFFGSHSWTRRYDAARLQRARRL